MNWNLVGAIAWWVAMVGLFIVAPVVAPHIYRGEFASRKKARR